MKLNFHEIIFQKLKIPRNYFSQKLKAHEINLVKIIIFQKQPENRLHVPQQLDCLAAGFSPT